jgi:hypothetical protein
VSRASAQRHAVREHDRGERFLMPGEPPLDGIGNFTGSYRCPVNGNPETVMFHRPTWEHGEALPLDGITVQTAAKLFNATGNWPGWFRWIVGWPVPRRFLLEAARLAAVDARGAFLEATEE